MSSDGRAWSVAQTQAGSGTWQNRLVGGTALTALAPAAYLDGRLALVALGGDRKLYFTAQTGPGHGWHEWTGLEGEEVVQVAAAANADGRLNVAVIGGDGRFYERSQNQVGEQGLGGWSGWRLRAQGPFQGPLELRRNADGRLEAFMRGRDGALVHLWQKEPNGSWTPDVSTLLRGPNDGFDVAAMTDGRLAAIAFRRHVPVNAQEHGETAIRVTSQDNPNSFWTAESAAPRLFPAPNQPPPQTPPPSQPVGRVSGVFKFRSVEGAATAGPQQAYLSLNGSTQAGGTTGQTSIAQEFGPITYYLDGTVVSVPYSVDNLRPGTWSFIAQGHNEFGKSSILTPPVQCSVSVPGSLTFDLSQPAQVCQ